ncbi:hypothetical protein OJ998_27720 [Solirubrobacter taibaiensis]|nr:hypothetical protein [Solirubrobacter taibaiensis]
MTPPAERRLPPGAIFPMDPTPVREDGLPMWEVEVVLLDDEGGLMDIWQRFVPTPAGVKVVWSGGRQPLARVDVEETSERVVITLWRHQSPLFLEGGVRLAGGWGGSKVRAVEVPLSAPLGERELIDGATGHAPDHVDEFDVFLPPSFDHVDLDRVPVEPMPT